MYTIYKRNERSKKKTLPLKLHRVLVIIKRLFLITL